LHAFFAAAPAQTLVTSIPQLLFGPGQQPQQQQQKQQLQRQ